MLRAPRRMGGASGLLGARRLLTAPSWHAPFRVLATSLVSLALIGASDAPAAPAAATVARGAAAEGGCAYVNVSGRYKPGEPGWQCGATLSGPSFLPLEPCPSSWPGSAGEAVTAEAL